MEQTKIRREAMRSNLDRLAESLNNLLAVEDLDVPSITATFNILNERYIALRELDEKFMELTEESNGPLELKQLAEELQEQDKISLNFNILKTKVEAVFNDNKSLKSEDSFSKSGLNRLRLPKLEMPKYGGELKGWLPFWGHFSKINDDPSISNIDKFQYLYQATLPNSKARQLIDSFPASEKNYSKVIDIFKQRFGKKDLLVEVYVRELLSLVIKPDPVMSLASLFDQVQCQLSALESLDVTTEVCAAMLLPLVESCLPEDVLRTWQRHSCSNNDENTVKEVTSKSRLDNLMNFLKSEVETEDRVSLAMAGFGLRSKKNPIEPSSTCLVSLAGPSSVSPKSVNTCFFCSKNHSVNDCFKAQRLTYAAKVKLAKEKGRCIYCLFQKHKGGQCNYRGKCICCSKRHLIIMCPNVAKNSETFSDRKTSKTESNLTDDNNNQACSKKDFVCFSGPVNCSSPVFLQTIVVNIQGPIKQRKVRALIDTGSSKSYLIDQIAEDIGCLPIRNEIVNHTLFGGITTGDSSHQVYRINVFSLDNNYSCDFEVLNYKDMCGYLPQVPPGPWLEELARENIKINDVDPYSGPIELLIGSDVAGRLYTGEVKELSSGLVALGTRLGWVLMGQMPQESNLSIKSHLCFLNQSRNVEPLWSLDVLGIESPLDVKSKEKIHEETQINFNNTCQLDSEGRYVVSLPWLVDHPPLPSNFDLAKKSLNHTVKSLKNNNLYNKYSDIFAQWQREGIIEVVPYRDNIIHEGHYLPHMPVLKEHSSTPVRPVFNGSARSKGSPSLNMCLDKGINLIELIPAVLLKFRLKKIGIISDIKGAFLQIAIRPEDRVYVRFLWIDNDGKLIVYQHGRALLSYEEFVTILCDCESIINSRPLTYLSDDRDELTPITPNSFLRDLRECGVPDCDVIDTESLNNRLKYVHKIREDLRLRFRNEYLGMLVQRNKVKPSTPIKIGELVLIGNDQDKRVFWPMAKVIEIFPGSDGEIRLVRLKTAKGELLRPVQRLYRLEVSSEESDVSSFQNSLKEENISTDGDSIPPSNDKFCYEILPGCSSSKSKNSRKQKSLIKGQSSPALQGSRHTAVPPHMHDDSLPFLGFMEEEIPSRENFYADFESPSAKTTDKTEVKPPQVPQHIEILPVDGILPEVDKSSVSRIGRKIKKPSKFKDFI